VGKGRSETLRGDRMRLSRSDFLKSVLAIIGIGAAANAETKTKPATDLSKTVRPKVSMNVSTNYVKLIYKDGCESRIYSMSEFIPIEQSSHACDIKLIFYSDDKTEKFRCQLNDIPIDKECVTMFDELYFSPAKNGVFGFGVEG